MLHLGRLGLVTLLLGAPPVLLAQAPGDYPRLVVSDGMGLAVPGPGGPFDNSGVFPAAQGQVVELDLSYLALGQPNELVFWGLLVAAGQTPFETDVVPPPLFPAPPLTVLALGQQLDEAGEGGLSFAVPPGVYSGEIRVQAVVLDESNTPRVQVSNGVRIDLEPPGFNVTYSHSLNAVGENGLFRELGVTRIDPELGADLKPLGSQAAPAPVPIDPGVSLGVFRFLDILPNTPDGPVNPLDRPVTFVTATTSPSATEILVADTTGFPRRGRAFIASDVSPNVSSNLWADLAGGLLGNIPKVEVVEYDGIERGKLLNCLRRRLGTKNTSPNEQPVHRMGHVVVGEYTMASSAGARSRRRVALDATNRDAPHVVVPPFTFTPASGGCTPPGDGAPEPVTMEIDVYLVEIASTQAQGFLLLDRRTHTWRALAGTFRVPQLGTWDPMVAIAPDGRSMLASLRSGPQFQVLNWDNGPDQLWAIRLDGELWPATCDPTWRINYELTNNPTSADRHVRSRRILMRATHVIGPDPDNYVAYCALAHKFRQSTGFGAVLGLFNVADVGAEAEYVRQEVLLRDFVAAPLTPPGSGKALPAMPRPYLTPSFQTTGFGNHIARFDPDVLVSEDRRRMLVTGGATASEEDVFIVRNVSVTQGGEPAHVILNLSGHANNLASAGQFGFVNIRPFHPGGGGQGSRACFSPDGMRAAWLARDSSSRDWIQVGRTDSSEFGAVRNVYQDPVTALFRQPGPYVDSRIVVGMRFADDDTLVFLMGRNPYSDPLALMNPNAVAALEAFAYDTSSDTMTNIGHTTGSGFEALGNLGVAGFIEADSGLFSYFLRAGRVGPGGTLPAGTAVLNVMGINHVALALFDVTGDELGTGTSLVPHLTIPEDELLWPVEAPATMSIVEGRGPNEGLVYFVAHEAEGASTDNVYAFNPNAPFVNLPITAAAAPGAHVSNVEPSPYSALVSFARTDGADRIAARQHPFVVDLNAFLYERDVLPTWLQGGQFLGRVMDGSMHYVPPTATAGEALVLAFGLQSLEPFGIANLCAPTYYPLAAVSDPIAEPVPVTIPLTDTLFLGSDFRFYVHAVTPWIPAP